MIQPKIGIRILATKDGSNGGIYIGIWGYMGPLRRPGFKVGQVFFIRTLPIREARELARKMAATLEIDLLEEDTR